MIDALLEKQWDKGYDAGTEHSYSGGYNDGYEEGVEAERTRVQSVLKMQEDMAMDQGKGTEAVRYRQMAEFLAFIYDPEKAEKDYEQMMKDF
jgi:flagellar biosynthesis/type III secretory pathway protein FliH